MDLVLEKVEELAKRHEDDEVPVPRNAAPAQGVDQHPQAEGGLKQKQYPWHL